jgi:hypothetical protein
MKRLNRIRSPLPAISEEMKAWSAALAREVEDWPHASARPFFGFTALYHRDKMFAALPKSRAMDVVNCLAFKITDPDSSDSASSISERLKKDARIHTWSSKTTKTTKNKKGRWFSFELSSAADLHDALDWLATAYEGAGKKKTPR